MTALGGSAVNFLGYAHLIIGINTSTEDEPLSSVPLHFGNLYL